MTIIDDTAPQKNGPPLFVQIGCLVGLTVVAIGIGWASGLYLNSRQPNAAPGEHLGVVQKATETNLSEAQDALGVVYLEPITTNLAGPTGTWVRLELALVFDGEPDMLAAQTIQQDTLAYLRTVKIHQIEGASGFHHLRADLEERAALRSNGKVKSILIRTMLFE